VRIMSDVVHAGFVFMPKCRAEHGVSGKTMFLASA
jgi:hypothetical protein